MAELKLTEAVPAQLEDKACKHIQTICRRYQRLSDIVFNRISADAKKLDLSATAQQLERFLCKAQPTKASAEIAEFMPQTLYSVDLWHDEIKGLCFFWETPVVRCPILLTPLDEKFDFDLYTHFSVLPIQDIYHLV